MSTILVVDDEPAIRSLLARWLADAGLEARAAAGAEQALELAHRDPFDVVVSDVNMPGHDGIWLAERLKRLYPATAIIIVTARGDVGTAVDTLRLGVQDYLVKPVEPDALIAAVRRGLEWHRQEIEREQEYRRLEDEVHTRKDQLSETLATLQATSSAAIEAMLRMLTLHDPPAYEHATRVAALAVRLVDALGGDDVLSAHVRLGALLHDLGKMAVGVQVLTKPERLSTAERELIAKHPQLGAEIVARVPFMVSAAAIVGAHHERWDGKGYPNRLRATDIPLGARIVMVADTFDALTNDRPYQDERSPSQAVEEIRRCRGTQFDPDVVDAFLTIMAAGDVATGAP